MRTLNRLPLVSVLMGFHCIKIDSKPICYHNYMNVGLIFISDLMYSRNNVESFNIAKDKGLMAQIT